MEKSKKAVEACIQLLIELEKIKLNKLEDYERDFLISQVKKPVSILARLITTHEQRKKN